MSATAEKATCGRTGPDDDWYDEYAFNGEVIGPLVFGPAAAR
jgi:hypothetical protein